VKIGTVLNIIVAEYRLAGLNSMDLFQEEGRVFKKIG